MGWKSTLDITRAEAISALMEQLIKNINGKQLTLTLIEERRTFWTKWF